MGLSLVFALLNLPIVLKHQRDDTPADPAPTVE